MARYYVTRFTLSLTACALALLVWAAQPAEAGRVRGYYRNNGTYVAPHYRSNPDSSRCNNYSTRGNVNPYTGAWGTRSPEVPPIAPIQPIRPPR